MTPDVVLDIARETVIVMIKIGTPMMLVALVVGLLVALFQALTQMQEMTLTFVPKVIAIFITTILTLPFLIGTLTTFAESLYRRIAAFG